MVANYPPVSQGKAFGQTVAVPATGYVGSEEVATTDYSHRRVSLPFVSLSGSPSNRQFSTTGKLDTCGDSKYLNTVVCMD